MEIIIRPVRESDAAEFARIGAITFALACPPNTPKADIEVYVAAELTPERFRVHMACSSKSLFAATIEDSVVGYLMLCREQTPLAMGEGPALEIRRVYVMPEFHGKGVAQALIGRSFISAAEAGCKKVWLGVSKHNQRGIAFYRKAGFAVAGEQEFVVGSDIHEDYIMSCELGDPLALQANRYDGVAPAVHVKP
jgi:ribosomal protein S18 acetylase RimI-like enzyme